MNSLVIAAGLLVLMTLATLAGQRLGQRSSGRVSEGTKDQANAAQAALVGLLALVIGFSLSLSLSRFEDRSKSLVNEVNAIGTAWLRLDLLPPDLQPQARELMRQYIGEQLAGMEVTLDHETELKVHTDRASDIAQGLWSLAARAARDGGPVPLAFATSVNAMIDASGVHDAALRRHMPGLVVRILFLTFGVLGLVVGYCGGLTGARPSLPVNLLTLLIVLMLFLIIDLDRPRRGLVQVDNRPLDALRVMTLPPQP